MAENSSTTPATGGNSSITGTAAADSLSGGGGSDTIIGGAGADRLSGDAPLPGQWQYSVYTRDFTATNNQTQFISSGNLVGHGYVDDFSVRALRNTLAGTAPTNDRDDYGVIYRSTLGITASGTYTFSTTSDDGSRIIIRDGAGAVVFNLDNDFLQGSTTRSASVSLTAGQNYSIEVYFWENEGADSLSATIAGPGFSSTNLATSTLLQVPPLAPGHVDGNDSILGEGGADTIAGGGGNDLLYGGTEADLLNGDAGNDTLFGGAGADTLFGGTESDLLYGGADHDTLYGDAGDDRLFGEVGNDQLFGGAGLDTLYGGGDNDLLYGDVGNDILYGGTGRDTIYGGNDQDQIYVGFNTAYNSVLAANDVANGEIVEGGEGGVDNDTLTIDISGFGWARMDITYSSPDREDGTITFFAANGTTVIGTITFTEIENVVIVCFTASTQILTDRGLVAVEALSPGDLVMTRDNGLQPLRWVGSRVLSYAELLAQPQLQPIQIGAGALAGVGPDRAMMVSP